MQCLKFFDNGFCFGDKLFNLLRHEFVNFLSPPSILQGQLVNYSVTKIDIKNLRDSFGDNIFKIRCTNNSLIDARLFSLSFLFLKIAHRPQTENEKSALV